MPALGGRNGHIGGGASLVALFNGANYTLKCCAGGGGGGGSGLHGGAGGGNFGQDGDSLGWADCKGGGGGIGGSGTYPGGNMTTPWTALLELGGNGGTGGGEEGGAGGGGYGGGGTSGNSGVNYSGGGGGGYCIGSTGITIAGSGYTPANSTDLDLPGDHANGGYLDINSNIIPAGDGYVVVYIINN